VQMEKQTLTTLKVVPIVEAVVIPMVAQSIADGRFNGNDLQTQAAKSCWTSSCAGRPHCSRCAAEADQRRCWREGDQFGSKTTAVVDCIKDAGPQLGSN
jgi:hypothetical protein